MGIRAFSVFLLSMILLSSGQDNNNGIKISLKRIKPKNSHKKLTEEGDHIILKNEHNSHYYGEIGVGTPVQSLTVLFDTGSSDMWVPNPGWGSRECEKYISGESSTYIQKGEIANLVYGDGIEFIGFLSKDDVTIGDRLVKQQEFIEVTGEADESRLLTEPFDGIIGLGFQRNSLKESHTIWQNMVSQDLVQENIFSIWLKYYHDQDEENGVIIFGGMDKSHFRGEHTFVSVTQEVYWEFTMGPIYIGGEKTEHCADDCPVMVDSGHPFVKGPRFVIDIINQAIGIRDDLTVDCEKISSMPTISFTISERTFTISSRDYVEISPTRRECTSLFKPNFYSSDSGGDSGSGSGSGSGNGSDGDDYEVDDKLWILGEVFMRAYHTVFDFGENKIGFAEAVQENQQG